MSKLTKKVDKNDLRRLMKGSVLTAEKKIESPYAKYNGVGQLWCTLCNCPVKTNLLWNAHVQGRTHKDNLTSLVTNSVKPTTDVARSTLSIPTKRKAESFAEGDGGERKYMRDSSGNATVSRVPSLEQPSSSATTANKLPEKFFDDSKIHTQVNSNATNNNSLGEMVNSHAVGDKLPVGFFDGAKLDATVASNTVVDESEDMDTKNIPITIAEKLPEGFFDDPKLDAKIRQVPYRDKMDDEWDLFQKTMNEETIVSEALVEEDDEIREEERNIEEIDDQVARWSRVTNLLKKREEIKSDVTSHQTTNSEDMSDSDLESSEFGEFLDWRSKNAWK